MSLTITSLVIGGNSDRLEETLFGLASQSRTSERVLVGCTNSREEEIAEQHNLPFINIQGSFIEKVAALVSAVEKPDWYWLLFADSCPDPNALEQLALTAETSPSASVVAPKLVDWEHPNQFVSFGKTITQIGESFELVDTEIDQGQHDLLRDVLAVDFAGSLIRQQALVDFQHSSTPMAAVSTVFGIKQWLAGNRVLLEPKARVRLEKTSSIDGEQNVFGQHFSKRFADYHLSLVSLPSAAGFIFWLLIPLTSLIRSLRLFGSREARFFFPEVLAGLGAFLSVPIHLRGSSELRSHGKLSSIKQLRAERSRIRDRSRSRFSELPPVQYRPGLLSGPWAWFIPVLVLLNYRLFPAAEATFGGNLLPLNANWLELIANGWKEIDGFPVDSLVFPVAIISSLSFWAPSAALGWFIFIGPALAFAGGWLALSRLTESRLRGSVLSLAFAISPVYLGLNVEPDISATISYVAIGFWIHGLIMIIQSSVSSRAWRWTAWSGFLMAMTASATPYLLPLLILSVILLALFNLKRSAFLGFVPVLSIAILFPYFQTWIIEPLSLFAPQGAEFEYSNSWQVDPWLIIPLASLFLVSLAVFVARPTALSLVMIFAAVASVAAFATIEHLEFVPTPGFSQTSHANGVPVLMLGIFSLIVVIALTNMRFVSVAGILVASGVAVTGAYLQLTVENGYSWGDYRQVPAIVEVESQRFDLNTLIISESGDEVSLRAGNGDNLNEKSVLAELFAGDDQSQNEQIAALSASLIASNSVGISEQMNSLSVAFVQLDGVNPAIASQLSRLPELTFAGQTSDGALWRVDGTELDEKRIRITPWQLLPWLAIISTLLIAVPTPASVRGRARIRSRR